MNNARIPVSCLGMLLFVYGCGAARLDDAEWKRRTARLAEDSAPTLQGGSRPDTEPAQEAPAVLAATRMRLVIERGPKGGAKKRWDVTLDGPSQAKKTGGANCTVSLDFSGEDGVHFAEKRRAYGYPGTLTVSANGSAPESGDALLPIGLMQIGLVESCALASGPLKEGELSDAERPQFIKQYTSHLCPLLAMTQMFHESSAMQKLMLQTIQIPNWWSLLTRGVNMQPMVDIMGAERVLTDYGTGYRIPVELSINGDPALYATITAVEPRGPLILCSGIVAVDGFAPHRPDEVLSVRYVGSEQLPTEGPPERIPATFETLTQ